MAVENPVLYITFARPEYARQSFDAIRRAKPKKLYFYNNKARADKPDEVRRNEEIRAYKNEIDWDCEVVTWFREEYVDVYTSLWGAIDWVFKNEEQAIIIEEDVVASSAFFDYCDKLLPVYKDVKDVWMISADNPTPQYNPEGKEYFFSRFANIIGWASWKDRWDSLDKKMEHWPEFKQSKAFKSYWMNKWLPRIIMGAYFDQVYRRGKDYNPWDFIYGYNMERNKAYSIVPSETLIDDIGVAGVHHGQNVKSPFFMKVDLPQTFNISEVYSEIKPDNKYDTKYFYNYIFKGLVKRNITKFLHF